MKISILVIVFLLLSSIVASAQETTHRCEVSTVDFNVDDVRVLGIFSTVIKSDAPTTKSFALPGTKLVVTASVLYMQSSPYTKGVQPSQILLTLILGKKAYSNVGKGLKGSDIISNARAVVPLKSFEEAQVETVFLGRREPVTITFKCGK